MDVLSGWAAGLAWVLGCWLVDICKIAARSSPRAAARQREPTARDTFRWRQFRQGDVLRVEDTAPCKGHIIVNVSDKLGFIIFAR